MGHWGNRLAAERNVTSTNLNHQFEKQAVDVNGSEPAMWFTLNSNKSPVSLTYTSSRWSKDDKPKCWISSSYFIKHCPCVHESAPPRALKTKYFAVLYVLACWKLYLRRQISNQVENKDSFCSILNRLLTVCVLGTYVWFVHTYMT